MFKQLSTSLLIASACILSSCTPTVKQEIAILPTPVSLTEQSGAISPYFRLPDICRIFFGMWCLLL